MMFTRKQDALWIVVLAALMLGVAGFAARPATAAAQVNTDCAAVEALMALPNKPGKMIQGGGTLAENVPVNGTITANDAGDHWAFAAVSVGGESSVNIEVLNADLPLWVRVYDGMTLLVDEISSGGEPINFPVPATGYYTLVVTRQDIIDTSDTGSYSLRVTGDVATGIGLDTSVDGNLDDSTPDNAWIFSNELSSGQSAEINLNLTSQQPLQLRVVADNQTVQNLSLPAGGPPVVIETSEPGYYTLIISGSQGDYALNLTAVTGPAKNPPRIAPIDQPRFAGGSVPSPAPVLAPVDGIFNFLADRNGAITVRVPVDFVEQVQVDSSVQFTLPSASDGGAKGLFSTGVREVSEIEMLDGDLSVYLSNGGFVYVQDYDPTNTLTDPNGFRSLTLNDGRLIRGVDWDSVQNLWVLSGCIGLNLTNGSRLLMAGNELVVSDTTTAEDETISQTFTAQGLDDSERYAVSVDWRDTPRISLHDGLIEMDLTNDRFVRLDRLNVQITHSAEGDFRIVEPQSGGQTVMLFDTDWENLQRMELNGSTLRLKVLDERDTFERAGRVLRTLESRDSVIRMIWSDNSQSLLLPEDDNFLELESPVPAAYDNTALPGGAGFIPANLNNTGQECYPANTVFSFNCASNGEVNPANGNLSFSVTDLFARGYRLDLALSRTYNSQNRLVDGPFGFGWNTDYVVDSNADYDRSTKARLVDLENLYQLSLDLTRAPFGEVTYTTASGSRHVFRRTGTGSSVAWTSETMLDWSIQVRADDLLDGWVLLRSDGLFYTFDRAGRLERIEHIHGGWLKIDVESFTLTDGNAGSVYTITDDVKRMLRLTFDSNQHIIRSELFDGETSLDSVDYIYDEAFLLRQVQYADGTSASYDYVDGLLTHHEDPRAPLATDLYYGYDENGRVVWMNTAASTTVEQCAATDDTRPFRCYRYAGVGSATLTTDVTGDWGRVTTWSYRVTNDPIDSYQLVSSTDAAGTVTTYEYQNRDNPALVSSFKRDNLQHNLSWTLDGKLNGLSADDWLAFRSNYAAIPVDLNGDDTAENLPFSALKDYRTDGASGPGAGIDYTYVDGQLFSFRDVNGLNTEITTRDELFGLPELLTLSSESVNSTIALTYNSYGYLDSRLDQDGARVFEWDAQGRLTHYQLLDGSFNALADYYVAYSQSADGSCMTVTDNLQATTTYCYDTRRRLVSKILASGEETLSHEEYAYDAFDRLVESVRYADDETAYTTTYAYQPGTDTGSWQLTETLPNGVQTTTEYDMVDRVVREIDSYGGATEYAYDQPSNENNRTAVVKTDANGITTQYEYGLVGQICAVNHNDEEVLWDITYDQLCQTSQRELRQIRVRDDITIDFRSFDGAGRPLELNVTVDRPNDSNPSQTSSSQSLIRYQYDALGRLTRIQQTDSGAPDAGDITSVEYAAAENNAHSVSVRLSSNNGLAEPVVYTYDALNRLVSMSGTEGRVTYTYTPNLTTHLLDVVAAFQEGDVVTGQWLLSYDSAGNLRAWTNEEAVNTVYEYDQLSRLIRVSKVAADGEEVDAAEYAYNAADQVTSITNRDGREYTLVYNGKGQITTERDFDGVVRIYTYNPQGQLQAVTDGLGYTTTYNYGDRGQLTSVTDPSGRQFSFDWSNASQGQLVVNDNVNGSDNAATTYAFDILNRLWQITDAAGNAHLLHYNASGYVTDWSGWGAAQTIALGYGAGGVVSGIDGLDNWDWDYTYNEFNQMTGRTDPTGSVTGFDFDRLGRLSSLDVSNGDSTYNRQYSYPGAGEMSITAGDVTGQLTYDLFGRLLSQGSGDAPAVSYAYGDRGSYVMTDSLGTETAYTYDRQVGEPDAPFLVVEQTSPNGVTSTVWNYDYSARGELTGVQQVNTFNGTNAVYQTATHINYDALGRPIRYSDGENNLYSYTYDQKGNLVSVQYPDGAIYTYRYDSLNRLESLENPAGQNLAVTYNPLSQLSSVRLNNIALENYTYNPLGWLIGREFVSFPDGDGRFTYSYDDAGALTGWSIGGQGAVQLDRSADPFKRITGVSDTLAGADYTYAYDANGRVTLADSPSLPQNFTYNGDGLLATATWGAGADVAYSYAFDTTTNTYMVSITYPDGQVFNVVLDDRQQVKSITTNDQTIDVAYNLGRLESGNVLQVELEWGEPNDAGAHSYHSLIRFDHLGHILRLEYAHEPDDPDLESAAYAYTSNYAGLPLAVNDAPNQIVVGYDNVYRPLTINWLNTGRRDRYSINYGLSISYTPQGNRQSQLEQAADGSLVETVYTYDSTQTLLRTRGVPQRQQGTLVAGGLLALLAVPLVRRGRRWIPSTLVLVFVCGVGLSMAQDAPTSLEYRYDKDGHLTSITDNAGVVTSFTYDGFGRITQASTTPEDISQFEYDAFGRLSVWAFADQTIEYRYEGERLAAAVINGETQLLVSPADNQFLLADTGNASRWSFYDALGGLRQSFLGDHTDDSYAVAQYNILGQVVNASNTMPVGLPSFEGMIYDAAHKVYVGLDGRAYDPLTGRYLQRDLWGPDASGNLYGYTLTRSNPLGQVDDGYPFAEAFTLLTDTARMTDKPTAASVLRDELPTGYKGWSEPGLDLLSAFNQSAAMPLAKWANAAYTTAFNYNPAGVMADAAGQFNLHDLFNSASPNVASLPFDLPSPDDLPVIDMDWSPADVAELTNAEPVLPTWYNPTAWRGAPWAFSASVPQPLVGGRSPGDVDPYFTYRLTDVSGISDLFGALKALPVQDAEAWLAQIDAATLPAAPTPPPTSAETWLSNWFTPDVLPVTTQLRALNSLPAAPGVQLPDLSLQSAE